MRNCRGGYVMIDMTGVDIATRSTAQQLDGLTVFNAVGKALDRRKPVILTGLVSVEIDEMSHSTTLPVGPVWAVIKPYDEFGSSYTIQMAGGISGSVGHDADGNTTVTIFR